MDMIKEPEFWVAVAFVLFLGVLVYVGVHKKLIEALDHRSSRIQAELDEAKRLMQESGVATPVKTQIRTRNDTAGFMEVASVVQANLAEIGIDLEIVGAPGRTVTCSSATRARTVSTSNTGWGSIVAPLATQARIPAFRPNMWK